MQTTSYYRQSTDGTFERVETYGRRPHDSGIIEVHSGFPREVGAYRILSDRQILKRKSPTLALVEPDPYWTTQPE